MSGRWFLFKTRIKITTILSVLSHISLPPNLVSRVFVIQLTLGAYCVLSREAPGAQGLEGHQQVLLLELHLTLYV